jgi:hypothetical protein
MVMKISATALLIALSLFCPAVAAPATVPVEKAQVVEGLIKKLPPRSQIRHLQRQSSVALQEGRKADLERLNREIKKIAEIAGEIRSLLVPGMSVFSYPGLLAGGEISYVPLSGPDPFSVSADLEAKTVWGYALDIGVPNVSHQEFRVVFDHSGLILKFQPVPNKR